MFPFSARFGWLQVISLFRPVLQVVSLFRSELQVVSFIYFLGWCVWFLFRSQKGIPIGYSLHFTVQRNFERKLAKLWIVFKDFFFGEGERGNGKLLKMGRIIEIIIKHELQVELNMLYKWRYSRLWSHFIM